jgi:ketosteroid isomerase-like protein
MLIERTKAYIDTFNNKDINKLSDFFDQDISLFDPANPLGVFGKDNVLRIIRELFTKDISFVSKNIFVDGNNTIIEFSLKIDNQYLKGVDIIEWQDSKIKTLRAYLY